MLMPRVPYIYVCYISLSTCMYTAVKPVRDTNSEPGWCDNTRGWNVMCKVQRSCGRRDLSYNMPKKGLCHKFVYIVNDQINARGLYLT